MQTIDIRLKPSRQFKALLGVVAVGSMALACSLPMPMVGKIVLALGTMVYAIQLWRQYGTLQAKRSITAAQGIGEHWRLTLPAGPLDAKLLANSTVTRWASLLRFKVPGQRRPLSCLVWHDSVNQPLYKQLLRYLRCCPV